MTATARLLKAGMELDAVPQLLLAALELDQHPVPVSVVVKIRNRPTRYDLARQKLAPFFL